MQRRIRLALLLLLFPLLLAGCPLLMFGDPVCTYTWPASAYEDLNGNGARDAGEPALVNVRLRLKRVPTDGRPADLYIFSTEADPVELSPQGINYCPASMEVSATAPRGYTPTTPTTAAVTGQPKAGVAFGFQWTGGQRPDPVPTGEAQPYYTNLDPTGESSSHVFTSGGDLWVALNGTHGPLRRYRDGREQPFETEGFNRACGIAADARDVLWMGICHGGGLMSFDGASTWRRYTTADGLLSNEVYGLTRASDGSIWAAHGRDIGYSRLDPATGKWQALPELQYLESLTDAPDGRLYFHYDDAIAWADPADPVKTARNSRVPPIDGAKVRLLGGIAVTQAEYSDSVWCLGAYGDAYEQVLTRYEPQADRWTLYTYDSTGGAMPLAPAIALDRLPDETLFVHTRPVGGYKLVPGPGGDPSAWRMVAYPQLAASEGTPRDGTVSDRALLEQLIRVVWAGRVWDTLIK